MKYIVELCYIKFSFDDATTAMNFAEVGMSHMLDGKEGEATITLVPDKGGDLE